MHEFSPTIERSLTGRLWQNRSGGEKSCGTTALGCDTAAEGGGATPRACGTTALGCETAAEGGGATHGGATHGGALRCAWALRSRHAQVLVEYALVFPLQLLFTLAIIQLAHLFVAKEVIEYGAFCGARAALVADLPGHDRNREATEAAIIPITKITGTSGYGPGETMTIPGWGPLHNSLAAESKTRVTVALDAESSQDVMDCDVEHDFELQVPVGGSLVYEIGDVALGLEGLKMIGDAPHFTIKGSCRLARPWTR